jgi:hypothetical protein
VSNLFYAVKKCLICSYANTCWILEALYVVYERMVYIRAKARTYTMYIHTHRDVFMHREWSRVPENSETMYMCNVTSVYVCILVCGR